MTRQETIIVAFVASPSDLDAERAKLEEVVRELNLTWSKRLGLRFELVRWETSAYPSVGENAQSVINKQIGARYDIFIGIMWARFGTPTGRAGSGTEEEFDAAKLRYDQTRDVEIMFYFKDTPLPPSKIDPDQLAKVNGFRASLGEQRVLYWSFQSLEQFEGLVRMHLARQMQSFEDKQTGQIPHADAAPQRAAQSEVAEEEVGLIDLMEVFDEQLQVANVIAERIATGT